MDKVEAIADNYQRELLGEFGVLEEILYSLGIIEC